MPIETVILYAADKILGRLMSQEPWTNRILHKIFPPVTYKNRLSKCIQETIDEYDKRNKTNYPANKFSFYHSQILFDLLSQYMLFDEGSAELLEEEFEKNPNIIKPREGELKDFYQLFIGKVSADDVLKTKFIDENYKERVFKNAAKIGEVIKGLGEIKGDTEKIKIQTQIIIDKLDAPERQRNLGKELTARLPLLATDKIVNRDYDLDDIRDRLLKNKQVVLVNGMGGIGKTTLAQLYMTKYYDVYKHLIWISVSTNDFVSDFIQTPGFKESLQITLDDKTPQEYFAALISAVKSLPHKDDEQSLMVIDNAEANLLNYCNYLPHPPQWHILSTSRLKLEDFDVKELDFLNVEQSVLLFKLYYKREKISDEEIKEIVKALEYHTLTIEILAKTAQNDGLDVKEIVNTIAGNYSVEVDTRHASGKINKITSYLSSIFDMSRLSDDEIWLLKQFCFLPPQLHSFQIIETILLPAIVEKQIKLQRILSQLVAKGWLLFNETTNEYKLHRIIGDVIRYAAEISFDDIALLIDSISYLLHIDQTKDNPVDKFQWVVFGNYLLTQLPIAEESSITDLQSNLAMVLKDLGDYAGAKGLLEKAVVSAEKNFGPDHSTTAVHYSNLALILQDLGDYTGAKGLLEKAIVTDEKNFGSDHPTTAVHYSNLAVVLQSLGDYTGAKGLLEKAVISDEKNFGPDHPTTAIRYSNLAMVLKDLGDYAGAKGLLEKAIVSAEKNFGPDHPTMAVRYSNQAVILQDLGDYTGAKGLLEKAVIIAEKNFGPDHPTTAVRYSNLAIVLKDLGDYAGAKGLLEKAVVTDEKNFGSDHPTTAVHYSNLAVVLQDLGDYKGAKGLMEKAVISDEKNFGPDHPTTAIHYSNLAMVLQNLGDYKGAKGLLEKAMVSDEKNFGPDHPSTAVRYSNLAVVLQALGDYTGAKGLFEKAVISDEKNFGTDHPTTSVSYSNLALVLKDLEDYTGAKGLLEKVVISGEKNFGPDHPNTARSYSNLAVVLQALGDYTGAKGLLEKAVISAEKDFGPDHPTTAVRYSNLALVLKDLGDYRGAKGLLEKSILILRKNLGDQHPNTMTVIQSLKFLNEKMSNKESL